MIAKNEGKTIRRALESALPFVDEYVIGIDKSSTDNTVDEVYSFLKECDVDARVYLFKWEDDFSETRNECIRKAKGDWIFILDGHEYIETGYEKLQWIKNQKNDYSIYKVNVHSISSFKQTLNEQPRLFKKKYRYIGESHNYIKFKPEHAAKLLGIVIKHDRPEELMKERNKQRRKMNIENLKKRIKNGEIRAITQLGIEYMAQKKWNDAIEVMNDYLQEKIEDCERYQVLIKLAMCYFYKKEYVKTEFSLNECYRYNEDKRNEHIVFLGNLFMFYKYYEKAKEYLLEALTIKQPETFWFLYPHFYYEVPERLLKIMESKIDNNKFKSNNKTQD